MNINLQAPVNSLGYGVCGFNVFKGLIDRGHKVAWWPMGPIESCYGASKDMFQTGVDLQESYDYNAPSLKIWHQFDQAQHIGYGEKFGWPIFELESLRKNEAYHLGILDKVIVCSEWANDVATKSIEQEGFKAVVRVVPLGVDRSIFKPAEKKTDDNWTTFFNAGKWEYRKGHDILIEAFNKAFNPTDRVRLWMLCHNYFLEPKANNGTDGNSEWEKMYHSTPMGGKIHCLPRVYTHAEVAKIMQEVDCGVFPSRGEGWNLELLEMMSCGKPVIATNWSAHTEFATNENCNMISIDETEEAFDGKWFKGYDEGYGDWAKLGEDQVDQLVEHMRSIHEKKKGYDSLLNPCGIATAQEFSWDNTVDKLMGVLNG